MTRYRLRPDLPELPANMRKLPVSRAGYPVPWFVSWIDGEPEFRCITAERVQQAVENRLCWVCGRPLGKLLAFVLGPMCVVNRTNAEPPCHPNCGDFSARACPFLSRPKAERREDGMPEGAVTDGSTIPGFAIMRNPGASAVYVTTAYKLFGDGKGGTLFRLDEPVSVRWFCEGRPATRAEVMHSIETGLPALRDLAEEEGLESLAALRRSHRRALELLPVQEFWGVM